MTPLAWILGVLLGYVGTTLVSMTSTPEALCKPLHTLRDSLRFTPRRTYMKYYFPVNYTIRVHHEEVLRLSNISKLNSSLEDLEDKDLQELWLFLNQEILKKILKVLPDKHPSYKYTYELEDIFRKVEQVFRQQEGTEEDEERERPERIQQIWDKVNKGDAEVWKWVKPKALLDNCYRVMHCLFASCFQTQDGQPDYCSVQYWRKNKTQSQQS